MKRQINIRISRLTSSQISRLENTTGLNKSEVITMAIDRMSNDIPGSESNLTGIARMVSLDNGLTYQSVDDLSDEQIEEYWDVLVNMMDDEIRERAHAEDMDFVELCAELFGLPCDYFENKRRFLKRYMSLSKDNLAI